MTLPLMLVPITLREANAFVREHHRHHGPSRGCVCCVAVGTDRICGVAIIGRPVARNLQDSWTAEVTRCCTDGTAHAASKLYGAAWRAVRALGYRKLITYTLATESGTSLVAAGWKCLGEAGGGSWNCPSRPRVDLHPTQLKLRWEAAS
ncbi:MAG TPA: XF1762 family protein [Gemmatimonadaceae bacterium]|nr:XF1762 family protein [Gemmatimonadaceae bacterium]